MSALHARLHLVRLQKSLSVLFGQDRSLTLALLICDVGCDLQVLDRVAFSGDDEVAVGANPTEFSVGALRP